MPSPTELREQTEARRAAAALRAERERAVEAQVLEAWPEAIPLDRVYAIPLYGAEARVRLGDETLRYGAPDERLSEQELLDTLLALPPLGRSVRKDSGTSFPLTEWVEALPEGQRAGGSIEGIYPVLLRVEGLRGHPETITACWYTRIGEVVVEVAAYLKPGALPLRRDYTPAGRDRYGVWREERTDLVVDEEPGRPPFWCARLIKWWSSAGEVREITVFWPDVAASVLGAVAYWQTVIHPSAPSSADVDLDNLPAVLDQPRGRLGAQP